MYMQISDLYSIDKMFLESGCFGWRIVVRMGVNMKSRRWVLSLIVGYFLLLCIIAGAVIIVDPYFHFHAPIDGISYVMEDEQYMVNGITKNFDYDTVITGSSTTRCFSTALIDKLYDTRSVRLTLSGESFKGVNDNLQAAIDTHPDLKFVIREIGTLWFVTDENYMGQDSYPEYLYDSDLWNDVYYIFNGDVLCNKVFPEIMRTINREPARNFDSYLSNAGTGKEIVLSKYKRPLKDEKDIDGTEEMMSALDRNLQKNVIGIIEENPDITFYLFFPPYSICWWDSLNQNGEGVLLRRIQMEKYAIEKLIPYENVRLFSFFTDYDGICDLDNYVDEVHYTESMSTQMLKWMKAGEYELTEDNYEEYISNITEFYCNYDYDSLFVQNYAK